MGLYVLNLITYVLKVMFCPVAFLYVIPYSFVSALYDWLIENILTVIEVKKIKNKKRFVGSTLTCSVVALQGS